MLKIIYLIVMLGGALTLVVFPFAIFPGDRIMVVSSYSMLPTLKPYDMIVVEPANIEDIRVGDIVAFNSHFEDIEIVAHRVVDIVPDYDGEMALQTKGDNEEFVDEWKVPQEDLVGKVVSTAPGLGVLLVEPVRYAIITFVVILSFSTLWKLSTKHKLAGKSNS